MRACLVVPHYDHVRQFAGLLPGLRSTQLPLVVVDDASPDDAYAALGELLGSSCRDVTLIRHAENKGKGGAVTTGLKAAMDAGYTHAIQVDADGQHDVASLGGLLDEAERYPASIICGAPAFDDSISGFRKHARKLTNVLCRVEALNASLVDAMCGFRCYPLAKVVPVLARSRLPERMGFDPEILVRSCWTGIELRYVPVQVRYPEDGRSHFRYVRDNLEITWMHTRLIAAMLIRIPRLLARHNPARRAR